ncbi:MAG TPA: DUF488 domain-containing protein [Candidatus Kapabacteria bacterium]|nr:DUF488 domain-containing protein [Candidatus Kapabacteria bacterium]
MLQDDQDNQPVKPIRLLKRQRLLLAVLESIGREIEVRRIQQLLFLICEAHPVKYYHFAPVLEGVKSFELVYDLGSLKIKGLLQYDDELLTPNLTGFIRELPPDLASDVSRVVIEFGTKTYEEIAREIFTRYPYYAINSDLRHGVLSPDALDRVEKVRAVGMTPMLYTIGYEGLHLEEYINLLIGQNVRMLIDVRKNAYSMKFGFSRHILERGLREAGIHYIHLPGLGVDSAKRREANTDKQWYNMFQEYFEETLPLHGKELSTIKEMIERLNRVAITCYEATPEDCHRSYIARALEAMQGWEYPVVHLHK